MDKKPGDERMKQWLISYWQEICTFILTLLIGATLISLIHENRSLDKEVSIESSITVASTNEVSTSERVSYQQIETLVDESLNIPYNYTRMQADGVEAAALDELKDLPLETLIQEVLEELAIQEHNISLAYYNYLDGETYYINANTPRIAGSIYKFPLVAMYLEDIKLGKLTKESVIPETVPYQEQGMPPAQSGYGHNTLEELMNVSIQHSHNAAAWRLVFYRFDTWAAFQKALADFGNIDPLPANYQGDNYMTAYQTLSSLYRVANDPDTYESLIQDMLNAEEPRLLSAYLTEGMACKYGQVDQVVNDAGIYFLDNQPIYLLTVFTDNVPNAYRLLSVLNLRINEWIYVNHLSS
ncbi:hypothetical protein CL176_00045 [Suicoccus acidiformans]|uniref:Beta-lactamase class A catalytic domain-containing protein n=2 Tax=Suicoccus acidiformans TaxID=2036206 RepID=A0A347WHI7_9LACT|nr:hypothetical protein CL176_00045 [Suicoccus acidiformans]